jgi:hypothetical protein
MKEKEVEAQAGERAKGGEAEPGKGDSFDGVRCCALGKAKLLYQNLSRRT